MTVLAIGTVQFGLAYGVANQTGKVPPNEVAAILDRAASRGIDTLDTAIAYGDSERRLGDIGVGGWRVVSKLPPIEDDCDDPVAWVHTSLAGSLSRLRVPKLKGLLIHRSQDLLGRHGSGLYRGLLECRDTGKVEQIGVSIYNPEDLEVLLQQFDLDLVQAPFNIVDRRIATSGWLARLHASGIEVHVRSAFLQGLLLMNALDRPARFARWQPLWDAWSNWLRENSLTPLQACLGFALAQPEINRVVVGVDGLPQFEQILASAVMRDVVPPPSLTNSDPDLINPLSWITT